MDTDEKTTNLFTLLIQPLLIGAAAITYLLGIGLSRYLGTTIDWGITGLGSVLVFLLIWMRNLLAAYFNHPESPHSTLKKIDRDFAILAKVKRQTLLNYTLLTLTAGAFITALILAKKTTNWSFLLILGIAFVLCFYSAVPPIRFQNRGYGEIVEAIVISNLIPGVGLLINSSILNTLLVMLTLPLTLLYLAAQLAFSFENYSSDFVNLKQNLLIRLGWQNAMKLHNILILIAFLSVAIFSIFGLSWALTWPLLLPLGVGVFQIVQMVSIFNGAKPRWVLFKWTAAATFGITAYMTTITLWIK
jgi:1,4-dihydroxy-2-naphthoate octaprenyltransferase